MKIDISYMLHMYFIVAFLLSIFYITSIYIRGRFKHSSKVLISKSTWIGEAFFKKLHIKQYRSFEKYDIWRFSGKF